MSSVFSKNFLGVFLHPFAPPLPPNSRSYGLICRFIEPKPRLYNSRFTTAFLLELYVEVTPPPAEALSIPCPPLAYMRNRARAHMQAGNGSSGRQYKAAKRGKNARKHANRINTRQQPQTPLKTLYTAPAVQVTQATAPTHEKTYTLYNNHTKSG